MIVISWNYQGVGSSLTVRALKELRRKYDPDVMFFMEIKNKSSKMEVLRKKLLFNESMYVELEGLSGGLALWWKIV